MDIGNQQRVIIVELDEVSVDEASVDEVSALESLTSGAEGCEVASLDLVAEWPLPLEIEPVS